MALGSASLNIRPLTNPDVQFRMMYMDPGTWSYYLSHFANLISYAPRGCFLAELDDGPIGMLTTTNYEDHAWIGWVYVVPHERNHGVATALMEHAVAYLDGIGIKTLQLEAVDEAVTLYDRFGFVRTGITHHYLLHPGGAELFPTPPDVSILPYKSAAHDSLVDLDTLAFGYDRGFIFHRILFDDFHAAHLAFSGHRLTGYAVIRWVGDMAVLGPFVALDAGSALALLSHAMARLQRHPLLVRVPGENQTGVELLEEMGFEKRSSFTHSMHRGRRKAKGDRSIQYGIGCPGKG